MANQQQTIRRIQAKIDQQKWRWAKLVILAVFCLLSILLSSCEISYTTVPTLPADVQPSATLSPIPTVTLIPTLTPFPAPTSIPPDPLGTIGMDFTALLCNADWMNGSQHLTPCPGPSADHSGGYAMIHKDAIEGYPTDTPVVMMVANAGAFFLRYPSFKVGMGDRLRATLLCATYAPCDVQFALEYYDAQGRYYEFKKWDYKTGEQPIAIDVDLSALAGQKLDFVLALRLFHTLQSPQHDNGLWVAAHIYRPNR